VFSRRIVNWFLAFIGLVALGGCAHPDPPVDPDPSGLPALPDSHIAAATGSEYLTAAEALVHASGEYYVGHESGAVLLYGHEGELTWAIFGVPSPAPDSEFNAFDLETELEEGQQAWVAVADYAQGSWYTLPNAIEYGTQFQPIYFHEGWLSPEFSNLYFAVICTQGNSTIMDGVTYVGDSSGHLVKGTLTATPSYDGDRYRTLLSAHNFIDLQHEGIWCYRWDDDGDGKDDWQTIAPELEYAFDASKHHSGDEVLSKVRVYCVDADEYSEYASAKWTAP